MSANPALVDWLTRPKGLATRLRETRIDAGLKGAPLARKLGWHQSKVSRIENGVTVPSAEDVSMWARAVKLPNPGKRELLRLQSEAAVQQLRFRGETDQARHQRSFADMHRDATTIIEYSTYVLPGPVQLEPYAEAVLRAWGKVFDFDDSQIAEAARIRADRAAMLRDPAKTHRFIITEPVLSWRYGGTATMASQLDWLATVAELPGVDVLVVPQGDSIDIPIGTGFTILDDLAITETWTAAEYEDSSTFASIIRTLESAATEPAEALKIIRARAEAERRR